MCDKNKKCIGEDYVIFYNNLSEPSGAIERSADNKTGEGDGDDEWAKITFEKLPEKVEIIPVIVTIHEAKNRNQSYGLVDNAFIHVDDADTGTEIGRYNLTEDFDIQTAVVFGEFYKYNGEWKFKAIGEGYEKDLLELCAEYGIAASYD